MVEDKKKELEALQTAHGVLCQHSRELKKIRTEWTQAATLVNAYMGLIGRRINQIKSGTEEIITDHAIVRYLERFTDVDVEAIRERVAELPDEEKIVVNNNIITVGANIKEKKNG